jgi:hypothetical protein
VAIKPDATDEQGTFIYRWNLWRCITGTSSATPVTLLLSLHILTHPTLRPTLIMFVLKS